MTLLTKGKSMNIYLQTILDGFQPGFKLGYDQTDHKFLSVKCLCNEDIQPGISFQVETVIKGIIDLINRQPFDTRELSNLERAISGRLIRFELASCFPRQQSMDIDSCKAEIVQCVKLINQKIQQNKKYDQLKHAMTFYSPQLSEEKDHIFIKIDSTARQIHLFYKNESELLVEHRLEEKEELDVDHFVFPGTEETDVERMFYSFSKDGNLFFIYYLDLEFDESINISFVQIDLTQPSEKIRLELIEFLQTRKINLNEKLKAYLEKYDPEFPNCIVGHPVDELDFKDRKEDIFIVLDISFPFTKEGRFMYLDHMGVLQSKRFFFRSVDSVNGKIDTLIEERQAKIDLLGTEKLYKEYIISSEQAQEVEKHLGNDLFLMQLSVVAGSHKIFGRTCLGIVSFHTDGISPESVKEALKKLERIRIASDNANKISKEKGYVNKFLYIHSPDELFNQTRRYRLTVKPDSDCRYFELRFFHPQNAKECLSVHSNNLEDLREAIFLAELQFAARSVFPKSIFPTDKTRFSLSDFQIENSENEQISLYETDKIYLQIKGFGRILQLYHLDSAEKYIKKYEIDLLTINSSKELFKTIDSFQITLKENIEKCLIDVHEKYQGQCEKCAILDLKVLQETTKGMKTSKQFKIVEHENSAKSLSYLIYFYDQRLNQFRYLETKGLGLSAVQDKLEEAQRQWDFREFYEKNFWTFVEGTYTACPSDIQLKIVAGDTEVTKNSFKCLDGSSKYLEVLIEPNNSYTEYTIYFQNLISEKPISTFTANTLTGILTELHNIPEHIQDLASLSINEKIYLQNSKVFNEVEIHELSRFKPSLLFTLFNKINFTKPSEPGYRNPANLKNEGISVSLEDLLSGLKILVRAIYNKENIYGVPNAPIEKDKFYRKLRSLVSNIIQPLYQNKDPELISQYILDLAEAGLHCGGRWMAVSTQIFNELQLKKVGSDPENIELEDSICAWIDELKMGIVQNMVLKSDNQQNSHEFLTIARALQEKGINMPSSWSSSYDDPFNHTAYESVYKNKAQMVEVFSSEFTLHKILKIVYEKMNESMHKNPGPFGAAMMAILKSYVEKYMLEKYPECSRVLDRIRFEYNSSKREIENREIFTPAGIEDMIDQTLQEFSELVQNFEEAGLNRSALETADQVEKIRLEHLYRVIDDYLETGEMDKAKEDLELRVGQIKSQLIENLAKKKNSAEATELEKLIEQEKLIVYDEYETPIEITRRGVKALLIYFGFVR